MMILFRFFLLYFLIAAIAQPLTVIPLLIGAMLVRPYAVRSITEHLYLRNRRHVANGLPTKIFWGFAALTCLPFATATIALAFDMAGLALADSLYAHRFWTLLALVPAAFLYAWLVTPLSSRRT